MSLNKRLFLFFIICLLLINVSFVYAQSLTVSPTSKYNKEDLCYYYKLYKYGIDVGAVEPYLNPIGCECIPSLPAKYDQIVSEFSRVDYDDSYGGIESGRTEKTYCYTKSTRIEFSETLIHPAGRDWLNWKDSDIIYYPGEIRECTDDKDTKYENIQGFTRKRNAECELYNPFLFGHISIPITPFCNDKNICSECIDDNDCLERAKVTNLNQILDYSCKQANYYNLGKGLCSYCQHIYGEGDIIITFAGDLSSEKVKGIVDELLKIQPFKYLNETGRLKFNYAIVDAKSFIKIYLYESDKYFLSMESNKDLSDLINEICPSNHVVYFSKLLPVTGDAFGYSLSSGYNLMVLNYYFGLDEPSDFYFYSGARTLAHELGHNLGYLDDEYFMEKRVFSYGDNIDNSECTKFSEVDNLNCFKIWSITQNKLVTENYFKSTRDSIMACNTCETNQFNIISCAAILEKTGESKEKALSLCKQWACEGSVVKQSTTVC